VSLSAFDVAANWGKVREGISTLLSLSSRSFANNSTALYLYPWCPVTVHGCQFNLVITNINDFLL